MSFHYFLYLPLATEVLGKEGYDRQFFKLVLTVDVSLYILLNLCNVDPLPVCIKVLVI